MDQSTVTATMGGPSAEEVVLTVSSQLVPALGGNARFTQTGATLTIPAGATQSTGSVTITPVNDLREEPDKTVRVSATVTGGLGAAPPAPQTLTIIDDDEEPAITLHVADSELREGASTRVWAELNHPWRHGLVVVLRQHGDWSGGRYHLQDPIQPINCGSSVVFNNALWAPLRIFGQGTVRSCDELRLRVDDDDIDEPDEVFEPNDIVIGIHHLGLLTTTWPGGMPRFPRLLIRDDDDPPPVRLALSDTEVSENGGSVTVSASLDWRSAEPTTIDLTLSSERAPMPVRLTGTRLTIPSRQYQATREWSIVALNDGVDAPDAIVTVTGTADNSLGFVAPAPLTLTIRDDDDPPPVRLKLAPATIPEAGGVSTVTAALDGRSSEPVTVTVVPAAVAPATAAAFTLSANRVLSIAADHTTSTGVVTIAANDDDAAGHKQVRVAGTVAGGRGVAAPAARILTIRDDDGAPLTLKLSRPTIEENGGSTRVTAALDYGAPTDTTVTVTAAAVAPATAAAFTLSANPVLSIAAGQTESTGEVTITARNDNLASPHKQVRVGAVVTAGGVAPPAEQTLVIEDDEPAPALAVVLSRGSIGEAGEMSAVSATLDPAPGCSVR